MPDVDGLRRYARRNERHPAKFFVGRQDILDHVEDVCAQSLKDACEGKPTVAATFLFQGAPGAGKSAILWELKRRWERRGKGAPIMVKMKFEELENTALVAETIAEAARTGASERFRESLEKQFSPGAEFGPLKMKFERGRKRLVGSRETTLGALGRLPKRAWKRPVCLVVDEIQRVKPEAGAVLGHLEDGIDGVPVVPVYAGLPNSKSVLESNEIGLSRLAPEQFKIVGRLNGGEAKTFVRLFLDGFDAERTSKEESIWMERIERLSEGWPQHLHRIMQPFARQLADAGGVVGDMNWNKTMQLARDGMALAHNLRRTPAMRRSPLLTGMIVREVGRSEMTADMVLDAVDRFSGKAEKDGKRGGILPKGMSAEEFLDDHLVRKGALQERSEDNIYVCPIPCFRRFLMQQAGLGEE